MKENRSYSPELKSEAVKLIMEQGLSIAEVANKLLIPKGTVGAWATAARSGRQLSLPGEQSNSELIKENSQLRKELAEMRMEREILKKATAYFARESLQSTRS